ncbi:TVP38/TMEM64 family protein [Atopobacter sp. AH10]|uniref:TVP38/TMEM64 family protein n=1 Tax=Atopobacter sp. AH10 TaxID=2315861 RepID=UPI000EF294F1|nr:VTT domain-containing protein [Atopobacter sp. AH10]RLK62718.1 TVP38/TMEM64 family protein [Atopobacter sp. AH10]
MRPTTKHPILRILALIFLILASYYIFKIFTPEQVRHLILDSGSYAELIYLILWTFLPVGFFPVPILAFVAGMGFGLVKGSLLTILGAMLNMTLMFTMARYLFRQPVQNFLYKRYPQTKDILSCHKRRLRIALALARIIPLVPYNIENYAFGLTDISLFDFLFISLFTIIPGTIIYVNVGDKALKPNAFEFALSIVLLVLLFVGTSFLTKYMKETDSEKAERLRQEEKEKEHKIK